MKRILFILLIAGFMGVAQVSCAQGASGQITQGPGNTAGLLYASSFGQWSVPQGNTGPYSWSVPILCTVNAGGSILSPVFSVGTPITIKDSNPANTEIVTPSRVTVNGSGCSITVAPAHPHNNYILTSATAGLQESINYAQGLAYQVVLTPDWTRIGGTTGMITATRGNSNVSIIDERTALFISYTWNGSTYVATPAATGAVIPSPQFALFAQPNSGSSATAQGINIATDATGNNLLVPGRVSAPQLFIPAGQNLVPDSAFTSGQVNALAYWTTLYGVGISSGWTAASNLLTFTGTGGTIPGNTLAESQLFTLPFSATSYPVSISIVANLTNQSAGTMSFSLYTSTGPPALTTQYCATNFARGTSATYTNSCTIPGNAGTVLMLINTGGGSAIVGNGQTITFSQPQVNLGPLSAYSPTVGASNLLVQSPSSATASNSGFMLWPQMLTFIPQSISGTLGTGQTPVTLTTTPQQILTTVSSAPTFNFGCSGAVCETKPGIPSTSLANYNGIAKIDCTGVTTGGTAEVDLTTIAAANNEVWTVFGGDGLDGYSLPIAVNAGTISYLFPLQAAISGNQVNHDIGIYDIQASVSAGVAPPGACQVTRASLQVSIIPTDSTTAGSPAILSYTDRSHLVH